MSWTFSQVHASAPDLEKFPGASEALAQSVVATLEPGDILYIPAMWAHEIKGLASPEEAGVADEHVLSVNRFWRTPRERLDPFVPEGRAIAEQMLT